MAGLADALRDPDVPADIIVEIEGTDPDIVHDDGTIESPTGDGGVVIQFPGKYNAPPGEPQKFGSNLAGDLSDTTLARISEQLLEQIEADIKSRDEWMQLRARAIDLLGFKIEDPRAGVGDSSAPLEGMSTFYDPLLIDSILRAHATACGELLPAGGPVKVQNSGRGTSTSEAQSEALENDLNYWLTKVAKEYYPDTKRMLFMTVFGGSGFKKGLHDPIKRRPSLESVDAKDVIVSSDATDVITAARVTHRISMRQSLMRRMQILGVYLDIDLGPPSTQEKDAAQEAAEDITGVRSTYDRPEDNPYTLYETYAEVDIAELAPKQYEGKKLPLPYRVTVEIESRKILDIRRDWREGDPMCLRQRTWVKYPYIEAFSFYCLGLMHMVGNLSLALTAGGREALDAGMMANFPGLLIARWAARQNQGKTNMRINAGEAEIIDTGERSIQEAVMGVPYKDVTAGLLGYLQALEQKGQRLAGSAELPVGEGRQDAPVGTTIALIEQATKIETNIHKGMHTAQCEEFEILERLFREDPESFWRDNDNCEMDWDEALFLQALNNCMLVPRSDPNTPSHIHRLLKAMGLKQLQSMNPGIYDPVEVDKRILTDLGWNDLDSLFVKPPPPGTPPPPPDPNQITAQAKMLTAQTGQQKVGIMAQQVQQEGQQKAAELQAEGDIEDKRIQKELIIHSDDHNAAMASHGLAALSAGHEAGLGAAGHLLDVHQALNPPEPSGTGGGVSL